MTRSPLRRRRLGVVVRVARPPLRQANLASSVDSPVVAGALLLRIDPFAPLRKT